MSQEPLKKPGWRQSRYGFAVAFILSLIALSTILRLVLFLAFGRAAHHASAAEVGRVFLAGFHRDLFASILAAVPLLLWFAVLPERWLSARWQRALLALGMTFFWSVQIFLFCAEYYFFEEFHSRFNTVAVDYLFYPHEVFINIWDSYPVPVVIGLCLAFALGWGISMAWLFRGMWHRPAGGGLRLTAVAGGLFAVVALGYSINLKELTISSDRDLNEIANNGALSFISAFWTRNLDFAEFYRTLPRQEAYERTRRLLAEPNARFEDTGDSLRREIAGDPKRPRLNVVILLEESLGSEFWGSLGRQEETLTPQMDHLAETEGMLFTNLYASGNRTVRGFEGVLSSFPPLPGDSIVKRNLSENVETVARVLKRDGYSTLFLYGGRGLFDGMRSFALDNGYDRFIEQKHFEHPTFSTIWGVCDEDLYARSIDEFRTLAATGKPFFATILSVSNHKPYTYPKGRIAENPDDRKREHAVKYADYALGQFFKAARHEPFWTNTIFAVVADHGARVYGSQEIPIHSYEIPLLIAGPAVVQKPTRVPVLGCSLDVSPTLLGMIGRPYESLFFGRDLLHDDPSGNRVLINHNRDIGIYANDRLVVYGLRKTLTYYAGDPKKDELRLLQTPSPADKELEKDGISLFQVADDLYMHQHYRLEGSPNLSTGAAKRTASRADASKSPSLPR